MIQISGRHWVVLITVPLNKELDIFIRSTGGSLSNRNVVDDDSVPGTTGIDERGGLGVEGTTEDARDS